MFALQQAQRQRQAALSENSATASSVTEMGNDTFDVNDLRQALELEESLRSSHHYPSNLRVQQGEDDHHLKSVVNAALDGVEDYDHRISPFRGTSPPLRGKFSPPPRANSTPPTQNHFRTHSLNFPQEFHGDLSHTDMLYNIKSIEGTVSFLYSML